MRGEARLGETTKGNFEVSLCAPNSRSATEGKGKTCIWGNEVTVFIYRAAAEDRVI